MSRKSPSSVEQSVLATLLFLHGQTEPVSAKQVRDAGRPSDKLSTLSGKEYYPAWWRDTFIFHTAPRHMLSWVRRKGAMYYLLSREGRAWMDKQGLERLAEIAGLTLVTGNTSQADEAAREVLVLLRQLFEHSIENEDGTVTFTVSGEVADQLYKLVD